MVEVKLTIVVGGTTTTYRIMAADPERAAAVLASSTELGCALLDAPYGKETDHVKLDPRQIQ